MNFFRSEEHLRRWEGYKNEGGIIPPNSLMGLFSGPYFANRTRPDYFSHMNEYLADLLFTALPEVEDAGKYWRMRPLEKLAFTLGLKLGLL